MKLTIGTEVRKTAKHSKTPGVITGLDADTGRARVRWTLSHNRTISSWIKITSIRVATDEDARKYVEWVAYCEQRSAEWEAKFGTGKQATR